MKAFIMNKKNNRRSFLKQAAIGGLGVTAAPGLLLKKAQAESKDDNEPFCSLTSGRQSKAVHAYNEIYTGEYLSRIAFPIGCMGAGMFCLEGTAAISHMSVRHHPELFNEPGMFAAICVKGVQKGAKVLEGPVPDWKKFGMRGSGNGDAGATYGLPRFNRTEFKARFPFCHITLKDDDIPFDVHITGWSPFIPTDEDNSSLPVGALEYKFVNTGKKTEEAVFSYNARNFMLQGQKEGSIRRIENGFVLSQKATKEKPSLAGDFAIFTDDPHTVVDYCWFRGGWWDPLTMAWNTIRNGEIEQRDPVETGAPGASLYSPFTLQPGEEKTIRLMMAWYVPDSDLHLGNDATPEEIQEKKACDPASGCCSSPADLGIKVSDVYSSPNYKPWYSSRFADIFEVAAYWRQNYRLLHKNSNLFSKAFYASTLPAEVMEAVAANLTILKSPTVLRQSDGRLWAFEGCSDDNGCCHGSCTHVWNYAQAVPHLFPSLERTLRYTEFCEDQNAEGHQMFRADLPIRPVKHDFYAAADGQLGGIMKVYREWRIYGNNEWMKKMYPLVKKSLDYCIQTWDPRRKGIVEEPHHNTYDIEFWGPDGMCTSFYLGALSAIINMGKFLKEDVSPYQDLFEKGKKYIEEELFNGEYFFQKIEYKNLNAANPAKAAEKSFVGKYSPEALKLLQKEGPKYQYGTGCLSDGILGAWIAAVCGLEDPVDGEKTRSHLLAVHQYNLKTDLSDHANPQRPSYALGHEGGLLLCTWPKGGKLDLPFVYSDEVWTGIEYQVASHLILMGKVKEGLEIVRVCRDRYDGRVRNPFNEYECGSWYARAMSSYGLLQGLTGVRYDAVEKVLYIDSVIGDFTSFLSTETGFGTVALRDGKPFLEVVYGKITPDKVMVSGKEMSLKTS
jgi:uncharacterized protein (DUF608 family)